MYRVTSGLGLTLLLGLVLASDAIGQVCRGVPTQPGSSVVTGGVGFDVDADYYGVGFHRNRAGRFSFSAGYDYVDIHTEGSTGHVLRSEVAYDLNEPFIATCLTAGLNHGRVDGSSADPDLVIRTLVMPFAFNMGFDRRFTDRVSVIPFVIPRLIYSRVRDTRLGDGWSEGLIDVGLAAGATVTLLPVYIRGVASAMLEEHDAVVTYFLSVGIVF